MKLRADYLTILQRCFSSTQWERLMGREDSKGALIALQTEADLESLCSLADTTLSDSVADVPDSHAASQPS